MSREIRLCIFVWLHSRSLKLAHKVLTIFPRWRRTSTCHCSVSLRLIRLSCSTLFFFFYYYSYRKLIYPRNRWFTNSFADYIDKRTLFGSVRWQLLGRENISGPDIRFFVPPIWNRFERKTFREKFIIYR